MAAVTRWDGFSEDDISKMKLSGKSDVSHQKSRDTELTQNRRIRSNQESSKRGIRSASMPSNAMNEHTSTTEIILPTTKVSSELELIKTGTKPSLNDSKISQSSTLDRAMDNNDNTAENGIPVNESTGHQSKSLAVKLVMPSLSQPPPPSSINLSDFKVKHKLMEEQNRARKAFLAQALEDRKKQTHAEHLRLSMIQEELQKLDQRLSCDVSIIRNQIEAASLEFLEAQKRYDRAEKEFLDAKLLLYNKLERKELLTHHLCTIIEQNEIRKAQKLSELMEKLQMPDAVEVDVSQVHENGVEKNSNCPSTSKLEPKRKVSTEIILTPTSVISQPEFCRVDISKPS